MKTILLSLLLSCCTLFGSVMPCAPASGCPADAAVPETDPAAADTAVCEPASEDAVSCPADVCAPPEEAEEPCEEEPCEPDCPAEEACPAEPAACFDAEPSCEAEASCEAEPSCDAEGACEPTEREPRYRRTMTLEELLDILLGGNAEREPADAGDPSREEPSYEESRPEEPREPSDATPEPVGGERDEVYRIVNRERQQNGLPALTYRADLQAAADLRAKEIVELFSHTRPNGTSCFTVVSEAGIAYRALGENIAYGQRSAAEVMNGWMNSSGHRANILSSNFTGMAVGFYQTGGVKYWVQIFIR